MPEGIVGMPEWNAKEDPADIVARSFWLPRELRRRTALSLSCLLRRIGEVHDVAIPLFLISFRRCEVENVIGVDVLLIEVIVVNRAVCLGVSKDLAEAVTAATGGCEAQRCVLRRLAGNSVVHDDQRINDIAR